MAFTQGANQQILVTTLDSNGEPAEPTNPVVTVTLDNGVTWEAPDNSATTISTGIALLLSAAETGRAVVGVMVASDDLDTVVQHFYFEDQWLPAKATEITTIAGDVANIDGDAMRGTDGAYTGTPPTTSAIASAVWSAVARTLTSGAALTAQQVRDALKLAPSAGDPAAGSIDAMLAAVSSVGANTVTLTLEDGDGAPVGGCPVFLRNAGGQLIGFAFSNASTGIAAFPCNDGDYEVYLGPIGGYGTSNPYSVTVSGDTEATLTLTAITLPVPSDPSTCAVYANMKTGAGAALGAGEGSLTLVEVVSRPSGAAYVIADDAEGDTPGETDGSGQASLSIIRGAVVKVRGNWPDGRQKTVTVTVPDAVNYNISTLLQP